MTTHGMNDNAVTRGMELRLDLAIDGIEKAFASVLQTVTLRGVTYTKDELLKKFLEVAGPWKDARAAHELLRQWTQNKPAQFKVAQGLLADFKAALSAQVGRESEVLTQFGFSPLRQPRPMTVEEKLLRTAKAKLTRQKRGTMGKRQKAEIKATENPAVSIAPDGTMKITSTEKTEPPA